MIPVEGIIGDLLLQHNCVIVPAFGGFVAQRVGAQLDAVNGTITPPRKSILFNRQLINNDGLLVASYAAENNTDYNTAQLAINEAIAAWEDSLKHGQRVSIDRVGFLYFDKERNLCFEQDRFYNLLMESYGLGPIHFVSASDVEAKATRTAVQEIVREAVAAPIVEFRAEPVEKVVTEADTTEVPLVILPAAKKPNRTWRYVAAAALLPLGFYSLWIPMKTDVLESGILTINDFNPFHHTAAAVYQPATNKYEAVSPKFTRQLEAIPEAADVFPYSVDGNYYIPVKIREAQPEAETPVEVIASPDPVEVSKPVAAPVKVVKAAKSSGSYVIVGCFSTETLATELVASLKSKGYDARTLAGPNGAIRVSAGNGAEFKTLREKLKVEGLSAWLLK